METSKKHQEMTLDDYVKNVLCRHNKVTFEEWWLSTYRDPILREMFLDCWKAAQENV